MASSIVLQTQENCPPGLIGDWARSRGIGLDVVRVDRSGDLPDPSGYDFAVALGSDASLVGARSGWVETELEWIRVANAAELPVLGVCFGAQALAVALGGAVTRLAEPEFGWIELETTSEPVSRGPWLALHEDAIDLPPLSYELARNAAGVQAFTVGRHLGVQFHPEATPVLVARWLHDKRHDRLPIPASLLERSHELARVAEAAAVELFDGFVAQAALRHLDLAARAAKP